MKAPDGWFIGDMIVFHELDSRGFVAKGFEFETPDLRNASFSVLNEFQDRVRNFLHSLEENTRAQFCWSVDSNYKDELLAYDRITEGVKDAWSRETRRNAFSRFWRQMEHRQLRREHLRIYLAKKILVNPPSVSGDKLQEHYRNLLDQFDNEFSHHFGVMQNIFGPVGCRIKPMTDADHFRHYSHALNPSYLKRFDFDPFSQFRSSDSIQANCWHCGCQGSSTFGFIQDGYYHNVIALKRPPQNTYPGILQHLTNLPFLDYSIAVNLQPLRVRAEISKEERLLERLQGDYASEGKHSMKVSIQKKQRKIDNLALGTVCPFHFLLLVHVWDESLDGLVSKTHVIKNAINQMGGAQYWESALATTSKNLWFQCWPGNLFTPYNHYFQYCEDAWGADLLPFSSTFTGHLTDAEAIYPGNNRNLIGVKTFVSDTPQPAVVIGMTRAGKSAFMCDLLSQIAPYYSFLLLIEEGLSYEGFTRAMGSKPIIIHPDGELTLNYFDTQGAPLTELQIATSAALVGKMSGYPADEDRRHLRLAQISQYIDQLYTDVYDEWIAGKPELLTEIARAALAVSLYQKKLWPGATFIEAWAEYRDALALQDGKALEVNDSITEEQISDFLKDHRTERLVRNAAFAWFKPEEFPTHSMLYQLMVAGRFPEHNAEEIKNLAALLAPWCHQKLVSGVTNASITARLVHFELGYIPEAAQDLKEIAGFLITNVARQHIITLPRAQRKLVDFEEVGRTLDIPGGEKLVSEFYAQLSKFNTWIVSIVQQYSRFQQSKIRPIVFGNAKELFLLKQHDRADLDDISRDIDLPEVTRSAIMNYPLPEHLPAEQRYSSLTYYHLDAQRPLCGTICHVCSPEMLACSSSGGRDFDAKVEERKLSPPTQQPTPNL